MKNVLLVSICRMFSGYFAVSCTFKCNSRRERLWNRICSQVNTLTSKFDRKQHVKKSSNSFFIIFQLDGYSSLWMRKLYFQTFDHQVMLLRANKHAGSRNPKMKWDRSNKLMINLTLLHILISLSMSWRIRQAFTSDRWQQFRRTVENGVYVVASGMLKIMW